MPRIHLSDGRVLTVSDSATPEQIDEIVKAESGAPPPESVTPAVSHDTPTTREAIASDLQRRLHWDGPSALASIPNTDWETVGGMVGSAIGKVPVASVALAGLGGAAGDAVRQVRDVVRGQTPLVQHPQSASEAVSMTVAPVKSMAAAAGRQALGEATGQGVMKVLSKVAKVPMGWALPKSVRQEYPTVDIPAVALREGSFPGSTRSFRAQEAKSVKANAAIDETARALDASGHPGIDPDVIAQRLDPIRRDADLARESKMARKVQQAQNKTRLKGVIGNIPVEGAQAWKEQLSQQGKAALSSKNPKMAALDAQMADAQRKALVSELHKIPEMDRALTTAQEHLALRDALKADQFTNAVARLRLGGLTSMGVSPLSLGVAAHGINTLSKIPYAQLVRAAILADLASSDQPMASHPQP